MPALHFRNHRLFGPFTHAPQLSRGGLKHVGRFFVAKLFHQDSYSLPKDSVNFPLVDHAGKRISAGDCASVTRIRFRASFGDPITGSRKRPP
jgi:hypothetical protein